MLENTADKISGKLVKLATFYIGRALCGINILHIQEINKLTNATNVPQSPDYVKGVLNLRGQIITVIDLGRKIALKSLSEKKENRNIIVQFQEEHIGLLVDKIGDVFEIEADKIEPAPSNIGNIQEVFFEGVVKKDSSLIGILNIKEILS